MAPTARPLVVRLLRTVLANRRNRGSNCAVCGHMRAHRVRGLRIAGNACLALCLAGLMVGRGWAATAPIYKCLDKNLGLVYTDEACKDGEQLDIRAGEADPAAVARLERQSEALDQSADLRLADQRRATAAGGLAPPFPYEAVDQGRAYDNAPGYIGYYGLLAYPGMHHHPTRPRQPRLHRFRHFAPSPPYRVPRR